MARPPLEQAAGHEIQGDAQRCREKSSRFTRKISPALHQLKTD
jgi:hypothetical protein